MARMFHAAGLALVGFCLTGCVAQEKYNALKLDRDGLVERLAQADAEARAARGEAEILKNQLATLANNGQTGQGLLLNQAQQIAALEAQLADINRRYEEALRNVGTGAVALGPELTDALQQFAQQHPNLVDFDAARGMVKFRSDVTFATGSAEVTDAARSAIAQFSQILNSNAARGYELMVAGHTDNQPVRNPETIRRGHLDNWYLSAHRAISVGNQLQKQGVSDSRIAVVGYADKRPIADNTSAQGRQQNRRVEVLILPTQARATVAGARQPAESPAADPADAAGNGNKDSVDTVDTVDTVDPVDAEEPSFDNK